MIPLSVMESLGSDGCRKPIAAIFTVVIPEARLARLVEAVPCPLAASGLKPAQGIFQHE
jgi:hypothetical protein